MATRRSSRILWAVAAVVLAISFAGGLWAMLYRLAASGEGYDYLSSYRTDPWGLSVFHDALAALPELEVSRNLRSIDFAQRGYGRTVLYAGAQHSPDPAAMIDDIETFVVSGGRLAIAFRPLGLNIEDYENYRDPAEDEDDAEATEEEEEESLPYFARLDWIDTRWGFRYSVTEEGDAYMEEPVTAARAVDDPALPESVSWFSMDYFEPKIPEWKTLYEVDGRAVVMERAWGDGSIAIASDAYFLCNEAMVYDRHPGLLRWVVGDSRHLIIDETIHNVREQTGVMGLIRDYGLNGVLLAFLVVGLLHSWRQAVPLVPRHSLAREAEVAQRQTLRDAHEGLVGLLARSVPPARLMAAALAQWRRTLHHDTRVDPARLARVEALVKNAPDDSQPVELYREIVQTLKERN